MPTALEEANRGVSAPLAGHVIADMIGTEPTETGALSGEHQWLSNGYVSKDSSIGHSIPTSCSRSRNTCSSSSSRPSVAPIVLVLVSLASLSLMLSSISLALTCVAMTTSPRQRRVGAANDLALYKGQTKQTSTYLENEAIARGSTHRAKDTKTSEQHPQSSTSSRRLSDSKASSQSVPCQCAEISLQVESESPVAAHVSGGESDAGMKNSDITKWQTKVDVSNKILCQDGRMVALESGLYAVYTQLYILAYPEEGVDEARADSLWHGVFRSNPADGKSVERAERAEEQLMKRYWTLTWKGGVVEVSSHLAGIFNLSSNDELSVRWSILDKFEVSPDRKMTYFGMYKIH